MSKQPVSSGLRMVFAIVTLFLGWLFAIMIPADSPIGRNWSISLPRKTSEAEATAYWLDGTGMRNGQLPANLIAQANLLPSTPDHPIMPSTEGKSVATSPQKREAATDGNDKYVLFQPKVKANFGNDTSKTSPLPATSQLRNFGNDSSKVTQNDSSAHTDEWELQGKSRERKIQDEQWQTEVQMPKITLPEFKDTPVPRWSDEIAKSISKSADTSGKKTEVPKEKQGVKTKPSNEIAQTGSDHGQAKAPKDTDHKSTPITGQEPSKTEPREQAVVARPVDQNPVKKAETTVADVKPKATPQPKAEDKSIFTPFATSTPINEPVVLDLKPVGSIQPERRPVITGHLTVNESATGPDDITKPSAEDANAFYAKSGQMAPVNLIPSRYNQDQYQIRSTDYSTLVPQTVQRQPGTTTTTAKIVANNTNNTAAAAVNSVNTVSSNSDPSHTAHSISAVTTYRPETDQTPNEVARQKNMSPSQYDRFLRNNSNKLDANGRFPAKTLLLIPE